MRGFAAFAAMLALGLLGDVSAVAQQLPPSAAADNSYLSLQRRVAELFEDVAPAVVRVKAATGDNGTPAAEGERPKVSVKVGTGFFVSREGHVVTNASIAGGANRVWIEHGDRSYAAEILASDPDSNFALLRVAELPRAFRVLPIAADETPSIGSFAVAVTAPLDLAPSPSFGLVAGLDRGFADRSFPIRFIRISIPAHPGEGGAPVLDLSGRVVGMMIASIPEIRSSYVLPVKAIQRLRDDVVFHGGVRPGWVGMDLEERPVQTDQGRKGVFIQAVLPETPAAIAGLKPGDHILRLDGAPVHSMDEFRESSFFARIGQVIALQIRRGTDTLDVAVTVGAKPPPARVVEATERPSNTDDDSASGRPSR